MKTPEMTYGTNEAPASGTAVSVRDLKDWFVSEVLPLEPALMQFLRQSRQNPSDLADLRQEIYIRVFEAAQAEVPIPARPFVFAVARNLLIDRVRRDRIVPIDGVPDLAEINVESESPTPDRSAIARDELRHLQLALNKLPPRCREAIVLRQIEGLTRREIAQRMGISELTVRAHLYEGTKLLIEHLRSVQNGKESGHD